MLFYMSGFQVISSIIWTCTVYGVRFKYYYQKKWATHETARNTFVSKNSDGKHVLYIL